MDLSRKKRIGRKIIKRFIYSQLYLMESFKILFGRSNPFIKFTVEDDPPPIYFHFKIREDFVEDFETMLNLPSGFKLTKIRCLLEDKQDYYYLTLNVYRVSGLTNGLRAEWSTYVRDPEGKTRCMIVEARSNKTSMDPIGIITKKSKLEHSLNNNTIIISIESDDESYIKIECPIPEVKVTTFAIREWIKANDEIYWLNGVYDRTFYNGKLASAEFVSIPSEQVRIEDTTKWSEFIEPNPGIIMCPSSIEFLISPWDNL